MTLLLSGSVQGILESIELNFGVNRRRAAAAADPTSSFSTLSDLGGGARGDSRGLYLVFITLCEREVAAGKDWRGCKHGYNGERPRNVAACGVGEALRNR